MTKLSDLSEAGLNLRVWCFRCARGTELMSGDLSLKYETVEDVEKRVFCKQCKQRDELLVVLASTGFTSVQNAPAEIVAAVYFGLRQKNKR